ncbi:MAG: Ig-like domain-containing protein [Pyramidobacter sp.]|nr:Ig-like domain-containing protein [Pyramidobacter sp.]
MKKTASVLSILLALLMIFSASAAAANSDLTLVSATAGSVDLLTAEAPDIAASDSITLTFSANVADDSIFTFNTGKISVKDAEGNKVNTVSVAKGDSKKILVVSLGDIAKGSYTLTIGKEFKDINENTLGKKEIPFNVTKGSGTGDGGGNNPLTFVGATVAEAALEGAELEGNETIVLEFDRGMKTYETENAELIVITKADGTKADYTVLPVDKSQEETKRLVSIQLNGLEGGDYTLTIGKDVKANNGNTLGEDVTINFTVKAAEEEQPTGIRAILKAIVDFFKGIIEFIKGLFR